MLRYSIAYPVLFASNSALVYFPSNRHCSVIFNLLPSYVKILFSYKLCKQYICLSVFCLCEYMYQVDMNLKGTEGKSIRFPGTCNRLFVSHIMCYQNQIWFFWKNSKLCLPFEQFLQEPNLKNITNLI